MGNDFLLQKHLMEQGLFHLVYLLHIIQGIETFLS